ncbi:MAG TPA: NUDIX domain-containing protein [Candidatus Paceibacterota bacterium]|nr:NUDIX domain-containing protein [Candidatus Paceibacterota bacterium]
MATTPTENELHRIAITGIIWRKDEDGTIRFLVAKRAAHKKLWPGKWTVPGGGVEASDYMAGEASYQNSESPQWYGAVERTLRREIKEEVGVEVDDIQFLLDVAFVRPDGVPVIVLSFYCRYAGGEVAFDEDTEEAVWITVEELPKYEFIQGIEHEIAQVHERLTRKG